MTDVVKTNTDLTPYQAKGQEVIKAYSNLIKSHSICLSRKTGFSEYLAHQTALTLEKIVSTPKADRVPMFELIKIDEKSVKEQIMFMLIEFTSNFGVGNNLSDENIKKLTIDIATDYDYHYLTLDDISLFLKMVTKGHLVNEADKKDDGKMYGIDVNVLLVKLNNYLSLRNEEAGRQSASEHYQKKAEVEQAPISDNFTKLFANAIDRWKQDTKPKPYATKKTMGTYELLFMGNSVEKELFEYEGYKYHRIINFDEAYKSRHREFLENRINRQIEYAQDVYKRLCGCFESGTIPEFKEFNGIVQIVEDSIINEAKLQLMTKEIFLKLKLDYSKFSKMTMEAFTEAHTKAYRFTAVVYMGIWYEWEINGYRSEDGTMLSDYRFLADTVDKLAVYEFTR